MICPLQFQFVIDGFHIIVMWLPFCFTTQTWLLSTLVRCYRDAKFIYMFYSFLFQNTNEKLRIILSTKRTDNKIFRNRDKLDAIRTILTLSNLVK